MSGSNRLYPDGTYTVETDVYQEGTVVGVSSIFETVTVNNAGPHNVAITQPATIMQLSTALRF